MRLCPILALGLAALGLAALAGCGPAASPEVPVEAAGLAYVGRETCASCHGDAAARYAGSDHDRAMEPATAETVRGDFADATFRHDGITSRFFQRGDSFYVHTAGPDGAFRDYAVEYTFGYRPLQQYLVRLDGGRLQALTMAWDTEQERWFSLYPDDTLHPGEWLHWSGGAMNWNYMCADCHSTDLRKLYDLGTDAYHTTWEEIDVSCEACHGPGEAHVAWAQAAGADYEAGPDEDLGLIAHLDGQVQQIDTCAPCHSRRRMLSDDFTPGDAFLDHFEPQILEEGLYFADGQILDEVYVYGSFVQSTMYHMGVTCTDCHDPHSTRILAQGNDLCTRCHEPATFDVAEHLQHAPGTAGAQCVDCHMPERTYMVVDPRRDHSLRVPRPDLSVALGTPNACNGCHADESAAWAAEWVEQWYGAREEDAPHFAYALVRGRRLEPGADEALAQVVADAETAGIVRATAVAALTGYRTPTAERATDAALRDPDPLVRTAALRGIEGRDPQRIEALARPLLADSLRLVRTEAARVLALAGRGGPNASLARDALYLDALEEYRQTQAAVNDQPAAHLNLGFLAEQTGTALDAEKAYRTALRLDSTFAPAHVNLAVLYNQQRMEAEQNPSAAGQARTLRAAAEQHLRAAVRHAPEMAQAHYSLGLLLGEDSSTLPEAAEHLATAARLTPADARMQYNAGLSFQHLGRTDEAERFLLRAHELAPEHPDYLNALSILYTQAERWEAALTYTERLQQLYPSAPALDQRAQRIRERLAP